MDLERKIQYNTTQQMEYTPSFFDLSKANNRLALKKLLAKKQNYQIVNDYEEQLKEYYRILNPQIENTALFEKKFENFKHNLTKKVPVKWLGKWVYYPWLNTLVHILNEKEYFSVRTARNKLLITKQEQIKFYQTTIGIGGLSVGSSVAIAIVLQGGAKHIKLADFDRLSLSNTNRVWAGVQNLGLPKVKITARQIYELNPYAKVEIFSDGITEKNISKFMNGLDIMVDEMDQLPIKLLIRMKAKKLKLPVITGADNADMAVIDIERYDLNPKTAFFHSRLGKLNYAKLASMGKFETGKTISKLVGLENHTQRMLRSLEEIGKTVVSWPQLGGTAMLNGATIAFCIRKIVNAQPIQNGRGIISFDEKFSSDYFSKYKKTSAKK